MALQLDEQIARKLEGGMQSSDAITLPFPHAILWVINGAGSYRSQGGALYHGGWSCNTDELQEAVQQQGLEIPADWKSITQDSRDGTEYEAYVTRSVICAPVGKRESWLLEGQRSSNYVKGGRRHIQVLVMLAEKGKGGKFIPWGPAVLSAKGYQARYLLDAFNAWDKASAAIRRQIAPGIPAWCFYLALGTFGEKPDIQQVGKTGAQSPITPIKAYIPPEIDEKLITSLYVGPETAAVMADLLDKAQEWLAAWKQPVASEVSDIAPPNANDVFADELTPF